MRNHHVPSESRLRTLFLLVIIVALVFGARSNSVGATPSAHSGRSIQAVPALPDFSTSDTLLDFWHLQPGSIDTLALTIQNNGSGILSIDSIATPAGFTIEPASAVIDSLGSQEFHVMFSSSTPGTYSGQLHFYTNEVDSLDVVAVRAVVASSSVFEEELSDSLTVLWGANAWGDYDNDGKLDVVVSGYTRYGLQPLTQVFRNTGNGFVKTFDLAGVAQGELAWGDYDNDGRLDLVVSGAANYSIPGHYITAIYHNTGSGFEEQFTGQFPGFTGGMAAWQDFDNDGRPDLLLSGRTVDSLETKLYRNTGSGFQEVYAGTLHGSNSSRQLWGDYNSDGRPDLLLVSPFPTLSDNSTLHLYSNTGSGFVDVFNQVLPAGYNSASWGDYDNDGPPDILITGAESFGRFATRLYHNTGSGFTEVYAGTIPNLWGPTAQWCDIDNDGLSDIVISGGYGYNYSKGTVEIYRNTGSGFSLYNILPASPISNVEIGDFNRDGKQDILITCQVGGGGDAELHLYANGSSAYINGAPTTPVTGTVEEINDSTATLTWSGASDDHTQAEGLSYGLRVGTSPGAADVISPASDYSTGVRRVPGTGLVYSHRNYSLSGLDSGTTYYWSVQALDNSWAASPFSAEGQFLFKGGTGRIQYRSFQYDSLIVSKATKRKNIVHSFDFIITNSTTSPVSQIIIQFRTEVGALKVLGDSTFTLSGGKKLWTLSGGPLAPGGTIRIRGTGKVMAAQSIVRLWFGSTSNPPALILMTPVFEQSLFPMPNTANIREIAFSLAGITKHNPFIIGKPRPDAPKTFGWVSISKPSDLYKSFTDKTAKHSAIGSGFDLYNGKPFAGAKTSLPPTKHNDKTFADLATLKINILISQLGLTRRGFGELKLDLPSNRYHGMLLRQIADMGDSMMTYHANFSAPDYVTLDSTLALLNGAFAGPIDTISNVDSLRLRGVRRIDTVPFLELSDESPIAIQPVAGMQNTESVLPDHIILEQNYPNPFNPSTTIRFTLPAAMTTTLKVFNILGQEVATLLHGEPLAGGEHAATFNAGRLSSGVYFYRLEATALERGEDTESETISVRSQTLMGKMLLIK